MDSSPLPTPSHRRHRRRPGRRRAGRGPPRRGPRDRRRRRRVRRLPHPDRDAAARRTRRQADGRRPRLRPAAAHRPRRHAPQRRHRCSAPAARSAPASTSCTPAAGTASPSSSRRPGSARTCRAAPRDDLHRHRPRPRPAARLRLRRDRRRRRARVAERLVADLGGRPCGCPRSSATLYHAGARARRQPPGHAGQRGDGAARRGRRRRPGRHPAPAATAALDNALAHGDAALTGPIVRGDVETVRAHLADIAAQRARTRCRRTSRWPAPPSTARSPTAGCCRSGPRRSGWCIDEAEPRRRVSQGRGRAHRDDPGAGRRAHPRRALRGAVRRARVGRTGRAGARRWARCTRATLADPRGARRVGRGPSW